MIQKTGKYKKRKSNQLSPGGDNLLDVQIRQ